MRLRFEPQHPFVSQLTDLSLESTPKRIHAARWHTMCALQGRRTYMYLPIGLIILILLIIFLLYR